MKKILLLTLLLLASLVAGCGEDSSKGGGTPDAFKVMLNSNVVSMDSAQVTDSASLELIANCIDGLMQIDSHGKAVLALANRFDVSDDGKTLTFHLRDAKWSNGDPVTANDFVFAWRRHCHLANEYAYIFGSSVAGIKNADDVIKGGDPETLGVSAPDDKTLVVELEAPGSFFLSLMAFPTFYPINEKFYDTLESGTYGTSPETFLSNGAFELVSYIPGTANIQLKKNENYWNAEKVNLKNLQYQVVSSSDNALMSFKNGTLDLVSVKGDQFEYVKKDAELSKNLHTFLSGYLYYLSFNQDEKNHHEGALANKNLRLAISHVIDRESIVDNYITNGAKATYTAVPVEFAPNSETGKYFAEDQEQFKEYLGFDVEKAHKYFDAAKAELGKDNFEFYLIYPNDTGDTVVKVIQALKAQIEENLPQLKINLQPEQKAEYLKDITSNNYDMALIDWVPDYNDPMTFLALWTTSGAQGSEHWSNAEYDKIIQDCATGKTAENYSERWNALYDAEKILLENAVIAPLYTDADAVLISPHFEGVEFHSVGINRIYKNVKIK